MKKHYLPLTILVLLMSSCATYNLTSQSFKDQLQSIDPNKIYDAYDFRLGLAVVALKGGKNFYNGIETIKCKDNKGNDVILKIKPQTAVRLTDSSGKRIQLYFDSLFLRDSLVYGSKSHLITLPVTPLNVNKLIKIEIQ